MRKQIIYLKRYIPLFLILSGTTAIGLAVVYDLLNIGGQEGFGDRQKTAVLFGALMVVIGLFSSSSIGKRFFKEVSSPSEKNAKPISILIIAIWFGLVTGLVEAGILAFRRYSLAQSILLSHHFPWIVPIADVIIFLIPGVLLFIISQIHFRKRAIQITVFLLAFMGILSWFLMFPRLHILASLVLGIGLAIQIMRLISSRPDRFYSLVRMTIGLLGSLVIIVAALMLIFVP